ncbi:hypothetical protein ACGFYY_30140 [Streptomyces sp. NPDC048331]|uniref:hypothetical protein n=1 Tax=Streptomyces sp. NPDC048331 TaxID=3365534 RepID=UPI003716C99D
MPRGYADRNARRYRAYTGIGHQAALQQMKDKAPGSRPISTAEGALRQLEGLVFEHLKGDVAYFAHPLGIASVLPGPGASTVTLDDSMTRHGHPLVAHAIEGLLPAEVPESVRSEGSEHIGVSGIRVARVSRRALHLTLVGTSARVILRSAGDTDWATLVGERHSELSGAGYRPCWNEPTLAEQEREFRTDHADYWRAMEDASWLPSGLLRRVGLLHEVSSAYCTRYWATWDDWKFELNHDQDVLPAHDALVEHLTDPKWGMELRVDKRHCQCDAVWVDPHYDRECRIELADPQGRPGTLQLRFRSLGTWRDSSSTHADLLRVQADPRWLHRVMPRHQSPSLSKARGRRRGRPDRSAAQ